jgi:hypothetical protein
VAALGGSFNLCLGRFHGGIHNGQKRKTSRVEKGIE